MFFFQIQQKKSKIPWKSKISVQEGWSALLNAAHGGHIDIVRLLLDNGASVDQPDLMGWSPLMWAVYKNQLDVVDMLIAKKVRIW